jgi:hypothetical protein
MEALPPSPAGRLQSDMGLDLISPKILLSLQLPQPIRHSPSFKKWGRLIPLESVEKNHQKEITPITSRRQKYQDQELYAFLLFSMRTNSRQG